MSLHLQKFIDRVQSTESRGLKDFVMPMTEARAMHADLTRLLLELKSIREHIVNKPNEQEVTTVEIGGGTF